MPQPLDATAVRRWCRIALEALGRARADLDAINVYPVADGDTGTNLYLTVESAAQAVTAADAAAPSLAEAMRSMAHGALIGARGNSGTILAQLLRGMAEVLSAPSEAPGTPAPAEPGRPAAPDRDGGHRDADMLRRALRRAAESAYEAVARPVEGTMLTVAAAAARAAAAQEDDRAAAVARAACAGARQALARTPAQLAVLAEAGVVDAGGSGLVAVLDALDAALSGRPPDTAGHHGLGRPQAAGHPPGTQAEPPGGPETDARAGGGYEVLYLLDAPDTAVAALRARLDTLGDCLVVVGGDGLWNVHVHTDEPGAAVEAGIEAGRPHRLRITHLPGAGAAAAGAAGPPSPAHAPGPPVPAPRALVAVLPGDGLTALCAEAGATALTMRPGEPPGSGELAAAVLGTRARDVVLLPNDESLWHAAAAAAEQVRADGVRVAVIPTRSPVQGIAALAVHVPERRFDEDVVAMTSAAGATRFGELALAERQAWTTAGICQTGDVLGLIDGDVAVIGGDIAGVAADVLERMLAAGGELVTLVLGSGAPEGLAARLQKQVRRGHLGVDTEVCEGRQSAPLLIGVE